MRDGVKERLRVARFEGILKQSHVNSLQVLKGQVRDCGVFEARVI
jgi:hypothetical protein